MPVVPGCLTPHELKIVFEAYEQVRQELGTVSDVLADAMIIAALNGPITVEALVDAGRAVTSNVESFRVARMRRGTPTEPASRESRGVAHPGRETH